MEVKLILLLLLVNFLFLRLGNYLIGKEKTPLGILRKKKKWEIHHVHIGLFILAITLIAILFNGLSETSTAFLIIGMSWVVDQISPFLRLIDYDSKKNVFISLALHIILGILLIFI